MPKFQITEKLLDTPLFLGLSKPDLHEIVGNTKFDFAKHKHGDIIVKAGNPCSSLLFLLDGVIEAETTAYDNSFSIIESISAPLQLQPERLFGLYQNYSTTFRAKTTCNTMGLQKSEVINLYNQYEVFRINLINLFAANIQKTEDRKWMPSSNTLRIRILQFFTHHCLRPAGEKTIVIKMNDLAKELNDSRLNVSVELNKLQAQQLISLSRGRIHIPALEHLYM